MLVALQKAMLRNPEVILETVGLIISGVEIDLSETALELSKSIIGKSYSFEKTYKMATYVLFFLANLYSKDDKARTEAADACKRLASKISDQKTLEDILKKCFDVLHGSEGKLTVVDYKMSVLQVIFLTTNMNLNVYH